MTKKDDSTRGRNEADLLDALRALSITAAHEMLSGFDRVRELRDEWRGHDLGDDDACRERRERMKSLAYELARHEVEHAERVLSLSHAHADLLFEDVRRLTRRLRGDPTAGRPVKVLDLRASLAKKEEARASFEVRSPFAIEADPRFVLGRFERQDGTKIDIEVVEMRCEPERVPPRGVVTISAVVPADAQSKLERGVYFADLTTLLVGDVEERVAQRLVRLRIDA